MSITNYNLAASTGDLAMKTGDLAIETGDLAMETGDLAMETGDQGFYEETSFDYVQCSGNNCSAKVCKTMLKIDNQYEYHNMCNECFDELELYVEKINNERAETFAGVYCHPYESEEFEISH